MPDVGGAAAATHDGFADAVAALGRTPAVAAFGKLEAERAADWIGFRQPKLEALADAVGLARLVADQLARGFVIAEIFAAEVGGGDQAVAAQPLDRREETEWLNARDAAVEQLADMIGKIGRDITVD